MVSVEFTKRMLLYAMHPGSQLGLSVRCYCRLYCDKIFSLTSNAWESSEKYKFNFKYINAKMTIVLNPL